MKKLFFTLLTSLMISYSYAQNKLQESGNVGIGTTSPQALLDVGKLLTPGELGTVLARLQEGNYMGDGTYLGIKGYETQTSTAIPSLYDIKSFALEHSFYGNTNSSINFLRGPSYTGGSISFATDNNTEKMRILYNGNVGIGLSNPLEKLAVNGKIHAQEIKVDMQGWPDYVFKPAYRLSPLKEIKTFIDLNHHLPGIPSAEQVEKEGVHLGDMSAKLLKKIEELTLHLIEKENQLEEQKAEIKDLSQEFQQLKKEMEMLRNKK
ncbi:hypothetical protein SAMN05421820_11214 [Pedobacter steynii]|uniref:Cell wall anchor protein n=1 Tax=Pedobacter steynii TaxID=430522 RepID=A0A1H0H3J7_9SPHI|nr:hypothetical protein [Pedobacter steynii]NQX42742.1 hypothetical protein [Pedobacter steynii]SDO13683.1 hypothetical protein SAMN05421820_11214 [Pedobacter steynii]